MSELPCCSFSWLSNELWSLPGHREGDSKGYCSLRRSGLLQHPISYHQTPLPWVPPTFQKAFGATQQGIACIWCLSHDSKAAPLLRKAKTYRRRTPVLWESSLRLPCRNWLVPACMGKGSSLGPLHVTWHTPAHPCSTQLCFPSPPFQNTD